MAGAFDLVLSVGGTDEVGECGLFGVFIFALGFNGLNVDDQFSFFLAPFRFMNKVALDLL